MLDATSGGTAGSEVAGALVQGVESVGGVLLGNKEVGAPPTLIVSKALQVAVEKVSPGDMAKKPFVVPSASGGSSSAGVAAPDDLDLPDVDGVGTVLWSSPKDVRGVDMGNASLGSPTLAFSIQAHGTDVL